MILKKKEFFLLIFLILVQSCSGGKIGNFLESSFNDLDKISQDEDLKKNLSNEKILIEEKKETKNKNAQKINKLENQKNDQDNEKILIKENKKIKNKNGEKIKKLERQKNDQDNKKNKNSENLQKKRNNKIKNSSKKRNIELQTYKIIFILKDADPKDPTKDLSTILRNSEVNFEIEKIERILDSKNKVMNKN